MSSEPERAYDVTLSQSELKTIIRSLGDDVAHLKRMEGQCLVAGDAAAAQESQKQAEWTHALAHRLEIKLLEPRVRTRGHCHSHGKRTENIMSSLLSSAHTRHVETNRCASEDDEAGKKQKEQERDEINALAERLKDHWREGLNEPPPSQ